MNWLGICIVHQHLILLAAGVVGCTSQTGQDDWKERRNNKKKERKKEEGGWHTNTRSTNQHRPSDGDIIIPLSLSRTERRRTKKKIKELSYLFGSVFLSSSVLNLLSKFSQLLWDFLSNLLLPFHLPRLSEGRHMVIYIIHQKQQQLQNKISKSIYLV